MIRDRLRAGIRASLGRLGDGFDALLGVSEFEGAPPIGYRLIDDPSVARVRRQYGGQLGPAPATQTRWYLADVESARYAADAGDLSHAARLVGAYRADGTIAGLLSTRTSGLVRLPKVFTGETEIAGALEGRDGARSVFDALCPPGELAALAEDGLSLGVGVGELVAVPGRDYPMLVRQPPEHLRYRWTDNRWFYNTIAGVIPIEPGRGRWVLHVDGPRVAPWRSGLWEPIARKWVPKVHAELNQANWEAKLANPARAAKSPNGATESHRAGMLEALIAWGVNTVFELPPGWDVSIIESNGRGYESFGQSIDRANQEFMIAIAGQIVTVTGGSGFANADIHKTIRQDLIESSAGALAWTINSQILPSFVAERWGEDVARKGSYAVGWDTTPPADLQATGQAIATFGDAITKANVALERYDLEIDAGELAKRFRLPTRSRTAESSPSEVPTEDEADRMRAERASAIRFSERFAA